MKNPIEYFFSLGEKVTKGDVKRKADWDYYLLWVMFLAFFSILIDNAMIFYNTFQMKALGWSFVMLAIMWFQYFGLRQAHELRKIIKSQVAEPVESKEEMLNSFKEMKGGDAK